MSYYSDPATPISIPYHDFGVGDARVLHTEANGYRCPNEGCVCKEGQIEEEVTRLDQAFARLDTREEAYRRHFLSKYSDA